MGNLLKNKNKNKIYSHLTKTMGRRRLAGLSIRANERVGGGGGGGFKGDICVLGFLFLNFFFTLNQSKGRIFSRSVLFRTANDNNKS